MADVTAGTTAADIGAAIQRGVELLQDIVAAGVLLHRDTANTWLRLHAESCSAAIRDDSLRTAFMQVLELDNGAQTW